MRGARNPLDVLDRSSTALALGFVVPIPTLTLLVAPFIPATEPSTKQLSQSTLDLAPIAVELFCTPVSVLAVAPITVLKVPVVLFVNEKTPFAVLKVPVVFASRELLP